MLAGCLIVFCGCSGIILYKPILAARPASLHVQCLSNLKQLSTATAIYLSDSEEKMPLENWITLLQPYTKNSDIADCPEVAKEGKHFGYAYKFGLSSRDVNKIEDSANTVLYFETDALAKDVVANLAARSKTRHEGRTMVSFLDTHAKRLPSDATLK